MEYQSDSITTFQFSDYSRSKLCSAHICFWLLLFPPVWRMGGENTTCQEAVFVVGPESKSWRPIDEPRLRSIHPHLQTAKSQRLWTCAAWWVELEGDTWKCAEEILTCTLLFTYGVSTEEWLTGSRAFDLFGSFSCFRSSALISGRVAPQLWWGART